MNISPIFAQVPADDKSSSSAFSVVMVRKPKRDIDRTSESECDSGKENKRRSRIPKHRNTGIKRIPNKEAKDRRSERYISELFFTPNTKRSFSVVCSYCHPLKSTKSSISCEWFGAELCEATVSTNGTKLWECHWVMLTTFTHCDTVMFIIR